MADELVPARSTPLRVLPPSTLGPRELAAAFLDGRRPTTLVAYRGDLRRFAAFIGVASLDAAAAVLIEGTHGEANARVLAYRNHLKTCGLAAATVNRRLAAVRSLVSLARVLGLIAWSIDIEGVETEQYRDTAGPGLDSVRRMLAVAEARTDSIGVRNLAIMRLMFDLALRRGEVVSLDLENVDFERGKLWILGKRRNQREAVTLPDSTAAALKRWVALRGTEAGALFLALDRGHKGSRLQGQAIHRMVRRAARSAGVGPAWPHGFRHTAATVALDVSNGDVRAVQRFTRHKSLPVLMKYDDNRRDLGGDIARRVAALIAPASVAVHDGLASPRPLDTTQATPASSVPPPPNTLAVPRFSRSNRSSCR